MIRYFTRSLRHQLSRGLLLYLLTLVGSALGVASVVAIGIINTSSIAAFEASIGAGSREVDLEVLPTAGGLPEDVFAEVLETRGVEAAWPVVEGQLGVGGGRRRIRLLGVDLATPRGAPQAGGNLPLSEALGQPGWAAVTESTAAALGWSIGDRVSVLLGPEVRPLIVGTVLDGEASERIGAAADALMDIAQAQDLFRSSGSLQRIGVLARPDAEAEALALRLQSRLGDGVLVSTPQRQLGDTRRLLEAFRMNLTAVSSISVLVGIFLIYTSVQSSLLRRRTEFGLLRSVGTTRTQLLSLILGEALLVGSGGILIGLPLGYQAAAASLQMVNRTLTSIYLLHSIQELHVSSLLYWQAAGVGLGAALAGSLLPAIDMARRSPREMLSSVTLEQRVGRLARPLFVIGIAVLAASLLWYFGGGWRWRPSGFVLGTAVLTALPLQTPLLMKAVCGRIPVSGFGLAFSLRSLTSRLRTTGFAAAALGVAVSMVVGITVLVGSFRSTVANWIESTVIGDIYVTSPPLAGAASSVGLNEELVRRIVARAGVLGFDRVRGVSAFAGRDRVRVSGVSLSPGRGGARYPLQQGDAVQALQQLRDDGAVLISEPLARRLGLAAGDVLELRTPAGLTPLNIVGVSYDYSNDTGTVVMSMQRLEQLFGQGGVQSMALYLAPEVDADRMLLELSEEVAGLGILLNSSQRIRRMALDLFDQTFAVVRLLQLMSLLIAVAGITLTLLVLARERAGEIALYRSLGAVPRQVFLFFIGKGAGIGVTGLLMGSAGGAALAAILIVAINRAYFGWTIRLEVPWTTLGFQWAALLTAAIIAAIYPAVRASRTQATELSHDDA